jgi:hypothetical protein
MASNHVKSGTVRIMLVTAFKLGLEVQVYHSIPSRLIWGLSALLPAHNVFNSTQVEPYTGRLDIDDYLKDLQLPHMIDLVEKYDAEIMVCRYYV